MERAFKVNIENIIAVFMDRGGGGMCELAGFPGDVAILSKALRDITGDVVGRFNASSKS